MPFTAEVHGGPKFQRAAGLIESDNWDHFAAALKLHVDAGTMCTVVHTDFDIPATNEDSHDA